MKEIRDIPRRIGLPKTPAIGGLALFAAVIAVGLSTPGHSEAATNTNNSSSSESGFAACKSDGEQQQSRWLPTPTTQAWQWQLQGKIDTSVPACVYELDGFETSKQTVAKLHREHVKVICYIDVGSWEPYRPDKAEFPRSAIGRRYAGFEEERWLDVAHFHSFERPLKQRFNMCAQKGFDGVEPDNVAGWEKENRTGFKITKSDQLRFNRWVARQVHARGMSVALKNDGRQAKELSPDFDFAVVEECFQYHECGYYKNAFVKEGKAVFEAEYEQKPSEYCKTAKAIEFSSIRKSYDLFAKPWIPCVR